MYYTWTYTAMIRPTHSARHMYNSCADWFYIPYAALEYVQDFSVYD